MGRHTTYNSGIADKICEEIASGKSLTDICSEKSMPAEKTVYTWLQQQPDFIQNYTRAREIQQDYEADNIIKIADTELDPNKARVRIDARKWRASKMYPKKYGDKIQTEHSGSVTLGSLIEEIAREHENK